MLWLEIFYVNKINERDYKVELLKSEINLLGKKSMCNLFLKKFHMYDLSTLKLFNCNPRNRTPIFGLLD